MVTPSSIARGPGLNSCANQTFNFVVTGGSRPYNVSATPIPPGAYLTPASGVVNNSGDSFQINNLPDASGVWTIIVVDDGNPQQTKTATITCN